MINKKMAAICSVILILIICGICIAFCGTGKSSDISVPEQTEQGTSKAPSIPIVSAPSDGTTPLTEGSAAATFPVQGTNPSASTETQTGATTGTAVPGTEPVRPSTQHTEPSLKPTEPSLKPTEPATQPVEPSTKPTETVQPIDYAPTIVRPVTGDVYLAVGGESMQLSYTYNGKLKNFTWCSYNPQIATVDQNGVVTPVSKGTTFIELYVGPIEEDRRGSIFVNVLDPVEQTAYFDFNISNPLYDGITKVVGNKLEIDYRTEGKKSDGTSNNLSDPGRIASRKTNPSKYTNVYPHRNYYITSSDTSIVSVTNEFTSGLYLDFLHYNRAGTAVITFTSWDGYSESYTIHVKDDYDCAPDKTYLTPGEYAYYATMVCVEDGAKPAYQLSAYLYQYLTEEEMTWQKAKRTGHSVAQREYELGKNDDSGPLAAAIIYAGWDESKGMHLFYIGGGSDSSSLDAYIPPAGSNTGKIRFPAQNLTMMECTTKLYEVLGDTSEEFVVYTSSDPSVLATSGGLLIAKDIGTVTVTATYKGQTATLTVTVTRDPNIQRVKLNQHEVTVYTWGTRKILTLRWKGIGDLVWTSSDPSIARISQNGAIDPLREGVCVITVSDGVNSDSCVVTVWD